MRTIRLTSKIRQAITNIIESHDNEEAHGGGMYTSDEDINVLRSIVEPIK